MLTFDNLGLMVDDKPLIHHATGQINQGDKITLIGQSGSGKSLLLKLLADLMTPIQGQLRLDGIPYHDISPMTLRHQIMLIHQHPAFIEGTVMDNLCLPFRFQAHQGRVFNQDWHMAQLRTFGKSDGFLSQDIANLSGGERQIVNFLRTLQLSPRILLLDEPTAALDEHTASILMNMVLAWQKQHDGAFVWISHSSTQINALNATTWLMNSGYLTMDTPNAP